MAAGGETVKHESFHVADDHSANRYKFMVNAYESAGRLDATLLVCG